MLFHVDSQNGVPVYEQIVRQMMFAVADGLLAAGDLLPSVRELAHDLSINPNTVARAYRDLQAAGVVEHSSGIGLAVRRNARRECQTRRRQLLQSRVGQAIDEAFQSGLDSESVRKLVEGEIQRHERRTANKKGAS